MSSLAAGLAIGIVALWVMMALPESIVSRSIPIFATPVGLHGMASSWVVSWRPYLNAQAIGASATRRGQPPCMCFLVVLQGRHLSEHVALENLVNKKHVVSMQCLEFSWVLRLVNVL